MKRRLPTLLAAGVAIATSIVACGGAGTQPRAFPGERSAHPIVAAWVVPYDDSLASLERNADVLTLVSPAYFRLRVSGLDAVAEDWDPGMPFPRARLEKLVAEGRIKKDSVLPVVGCIGPCGPQISRILDDAAARAKHVSALTALAKAQGLSGLFVDYEDVDAKTANVTAFVHELSLALHDAGKKLGLVVQEPCGAGPVCKRSPYPFDLRAIAGDVEVLAIMEYDYAVDGSTAPAPRKWVRAGLEAVVRAVGSETSRQKVVCAVPLYGRATTGVLDDTAVLYSDIVAKRAGTKSFEIGTPVYDDEALSMISTLRAGDKSGRVYFENRETLAKRLALLSEVGLGGVALWRLGSEDPCTSTELARFRGMAPSGGCSTTAK